MSAVDSRVEIIDKILANKMKKTDVKAALVALENEFGENAYVDDAFSPKEKPWSKDYYLELKRISLSGVSSKRFILHLVEVRDYLHFKVMVTIGSIVAVLIIIVIISTLI